MAQTFLQMPPEQGSTRFGPIEGGILYFGADPARCQIVMAAQHGIAPAHAMLTDNGNGTYTVQPVQMGLTVFIVKADETTLRPLEGAATVNAGDSIVLGNIAGPRFIIHRDAGQISVGNMGKASWTDAIGSTFGGTPPGSSGMGGRVAQEAWRQQKARMLHRNPAYRTAYNLYYRMRGGQWKSPYFIVATAGTLITACAGGSATIGAVLWKIFEF